MRAAAPLRRLLLAAVLALGLHGPARAGFVEGANAYNARDYAAALREIAPLAASGQADAQHLLGLMYYMGRGVPRDYKLAMQWHRKAALQGKADAQYVLGAMYYTGNAVPRDHAQAAAWFRKAAVQGHPEAQHALGLLYRYHQAGLPQDLVLAYMLFKLSAAGGNANAALQRDSLMRRLRQDQIDEGGALARAWTPGVALPSRSHTG